MDKDTYPEHAKRLWVLPGAHMLIHMGPRPKTCVETRRYQHDPSSTVEISFAVVDTGRGYKPGRARYDEVTLGFSAFEDRDEAFDAWGRQLEGHRQECERLLARLEESKRIAATSDD